jgi:anti-sigma B factor antagonist
MTEEADARGSGGPSPTDSHIALRVTHEGACVVVTLAGELDPHSAPSLRSTVDGLGADTRELVLDLAAITFIDSSGLREIIHANEALASRGGRLVLRRPSSTTVRLLEISGLTEHLQIDA